MDTAEATETGTRSGIQHAATMLREAAEARKCWACGCLAHALDTIDQAREARGRLDTFDVALATARERLQPQRYECLGCDICFPAVALNDLAAEGVLDLSEAANCPTDSVKERNGWPPLPGAYTILRHRAPVAVCTLNDDALMEAVGRAKPSELSIVGTLHTENLGIERLVSNVVANPHIRFVIVCGHDSRRLVGHLPGQSLVALATNGVDDRHRIVEAKGKRPVLRNLDRATIDHFRNFIEVINLIGVTDLDAILVAVRECAERDPGPATSFDDRRAVVPMKGEVPAQMVADPNGYFVIFPDSGRRLLSLEHYANNGVLTATIEARTAAEVYMTAIGHNLLSRLDHAAYLGRELARAEHALVSGERFVQDAAPEIESSDSCGCGGACEGAHKVQTLAA